MRIKHILTGITTIMAFIFSYLQILVMENAEQFLAVLCVMFLDGTLGIIAGTKTEGFKTNKALGVLKNTVLWLVILATVIIMERGFKISWLSETIILPFIVFQLISALKNANRAGYIRNELLTAILLKVDQHKAQSS